MSEKEHQERFINHCTSVGLLAFALIPRTAIKRFSVYGMLKKYPDVRVEDFNAYFEIKDPQYKKAHKERQEKQKETLAELAKHGAKTFLCEGGADEAIEIVDKLRRAENV